MSRSRVVVSLLACILAVAAPLVAQVRTGEVVGRVSDESGTGVAGALVSLEGPALLEARTATTATGGAYRFPDVPIGVYTVRVELAGFARLVNQGVRIDAGFTAEVNTRLTVSPREETVTVTGAGPVVDTRSTTLVSNFTRELLENLPTARDPWVILEQTPGMVLDRQNVGGSESGQQSSFLTHGSATNQMWNLDGATITDMAAGSSPGYYDFDSFEEIQISTGGNDASQDSGGVSINMVTKTGSNTFRGSSRIFLVDQGLQSDNITPELKAQGAGFGNPIQNIKEYGFELGGPIKRNKLWFWGGVSQSDIKVGVIGFLKPGATDPADPASLETDLTTLKNVNLKLTYQWARGHKSSLLYNLGDKERNARGAGPLSPPETTVRQTSPGFMAFFDHQWIASDRLTLNLKATHVDGGFLLDFHADELAGVQPRFDIVTQMNGRSGTRTENIRPTTEVRVDGNYFVPGLLGGDHAMKFGVRYRSTPYETLTRTGGGAVARFRNGVPSEANIVRDGHTSRGLWEYSAYVNDSFKRGRTTLNVGLRLDYQDDEARSANIPANPILPDRLPAVDFSGADSGAEFADLSPRLGLTYDLRGTGKTVLKASLARYYGLGIYTAGTISPTGQTTLRYPWRDLNADGFVQRNELDLTRLLLFSSNYDPANPTSIQSAATVDPGLSNDKTDELVAGIEHELAQDLGVSLSYIYRHYYNYNDSFRVGLSSAQFVPVPLTAACGNTSCDQSSYSVTYWQLPFQRPAATVLRNHDAGRRYHGLELVARKRLSHGWLMNASLTYNSTRYFYDGGPDVDYQDPTNVAQQDGSQIGTLNVRWVAKLSGMVQLPAGFNLSGFLNLRQGFPFNRTVLSPSRTGGLGTVNVFVRPYASERYPTFRQIDMSLDKHFPMGRARLTASMAVFNLLNESLVLSRIARQNASNANNVTEVLAPRVVRLGLRMQF